MRRLARWMAVFALAAACARAGDADDARRVAERFLRAAERGDAAEMFRALPPGYQKDVNGLFKAYAEKTDPEIWKAGSALADEAADVTAARAELVAGLVNSLDEPGPGRDGKKKKKGKGKKAAKPKKPVLDAASVRTAAEIFRAVNKAAARDALRQGDLAKTLSGPEVARAFVRLAETDANPFRGVKITGAKKEKDGEIEIVYIRADGKADTVDFVRAGGGWAPEDLADDWKETIAKARKSIAEQKPPTLEARKKILASVPAIRATLKQLRAAKDADTFQMGLTMLMMQAPEARKKISAAMPALRETLKQLRAAKDAESFQMGLTMLMMQAVLAAPDEALGEAEAPAPRNGPGPMRERVSR